MKIQSLFLTTNTVTRKVISDRAYTHLMQAGCDFDLTVVAEDLCDSKVSLIGPILRRWGNGDVQVVSGECTGHRAMVNNMLRGLAGMDDEAILVYCEDHILVNELPSKSWLIDFFENKNVGWLCLNTHVHEENLCNVSGFVEKPGREEKLDFVKNPMNWLRCGKYDVLVKNHPITDEYLLNFPVAITKVKYFKQILNFACINFRDVGIEVGFTLAWKAIFPHIPVGILINQSNLKGKDIQSFQDLHNCALMRFRNNDPRMMHDSVVDHKDLPKNDNDKRAFF